MDLPDTFRQNIIDDYTKIIDVVEEVARSVDVEIWQLLLAVLGRPLPRVNGVCKLWVTVEPMNDYYYYVVYRDADGKWKLGEVLHRPTHCVFCNCAMEWEWGGDVAVLPSVAAKKLMLLSLLVKLTDDKTKRRLYRFALWLARRSSYFDDPFADP